MIFSALKSRRSHCSPAQQRPTPSSRDSAARTAASAARLLWPFDASRWPVGLATNREIFRQWPSTKKEWPDQTLITTGCYMGTSHWMIWMHKTSRSKKETGRKGRTREFGSRAPCPHCIRVPHQTRTALPGGTFTWFAPQVPCVETLFAAVSCASISDGWSWVLSQEFFLKQQCQTPIGKLQMMLSVWGSILNPWIIPKNHLWLALKW